MGKPKLTYFSARGLCEPIRLLLKDANVDYEEVGLGAPVNGVFPEAFTKLKESGTLDFGSVPLWEEDGFHLVQSFAIARHLARKHGYNGENENEAAKIDSVVEGVRDAMLALRKIFNVPEDQRVQVWKEVVEKDLPKWFGFFEALLKKNGSGYFVGNKISLADIYVISLTEEARHAKLGIDAFPLLFAHIDTILSRPNLASYVADPKRYPPNFDRFIPK
jgi:glutathione S-transferase